MQAGVRPPTTLGVLLVVKSVRPGSTRSGEKARWKSTPAVSPEPASRIGASSSRVVPGYVVLYKVTSWPRCKCPASLAVASKTRLRSGSRLAFSGVGRQMMSASQSSVAA